MQGHIHKRVHTCRDGRETNRWYVVIEADRGLDGRRRQQWHGGFFSRREAEVARARLVNDVHNNRYVTRNSLTLEAWVQQSWLPLMETRVKPTTLSGYRQTMETYVLPRLGSRRVQKLTTLELDALYAQLIRGEKSGRPLSLKTVANVHRAVHKALSDAVDAGLVVDNVASRAKPPRPWRLRSDRVSTWMPSELAWFLNAVATDRLAAVWRLAAMTGMRRGELLGLRWNDLDLEHARLWVRRALVEVNYAVLESTTKGNAARTIDLDWRTVGTLTSHRQAQERESQEWGDDYEHNDLVVRLAERVADPPPNFQPHVPGPCGESRAPSDQVARSATHARHARSAGGGARDDHQRAPWTPQPGVHAQAIRSRPPRNAGAGGGRRCRNAARSGASDERAS